MEDPFQNSKLQPSQQQPEAKPPQQEVIVPTRLSKLKFWIILGGIFVLLLLLAGSYFYWRYYTTDKLINLAPVDSVLYVQARNSIWPWREEGISDLPFTDFYQQIDGAFPFTDVDLKNDLLANSQQAAFILVLNEDSNLDSVFLFKLQKSGSVESVLSKLAFYSIFDKNILVVATSESALNKIKEVASGSIFSLATQVEAKKFGCGLLHFYLDADNLKFYLNQKKDLSSRIFNRLLGDNIYLSLDKKCGQWKFKLAGKSFQQLTSEKTLTEYLPNNFSVFLSNINLFEIFTAWGEVDQNFSESFRQIVDSAKAVYNFDFNGTISAFLNQPADLMIFNTQDETALGFNYILVLSPMSKEQIDDFKELIKIILAQKLPREVEYFLPDNSKVIELLAETDVWQWQQDESGVSYLQEPALNFAISYLAGNNKMIISNSTKLLMSFITTKDIVLAELVSQCNKDTLAGYLIFNDNNIPSNFSVYLPDGITVIRGDNRGCIVNF